MSEFAVTVVPPNGRRSAHLLDFHRPVRELLPPLVQQCDLPAHLNYQLIPAGWSRALDDRKTLTEAGITPGAELHLRPVRDRLLQMLLDKLYEEAQGYIKDQLWELAKERLFQIDRLDPSYPDPKGLRSRLGGTSGSTVREPVRKSEPPQPKSRSSMGCLFLVIIVVGGITLLGLGVVAVIFWGLLSLPEMAATVQPGQSSQEEVMLGTGDVQITLRWENTADLDLHVMDPLGEEIWYDYRVSGSGGQLDVDANAACMTYMERPVENVFWPYGGAPTGKYEVYVVYFQDCGGIGATNYELTVKVDGQVVDVVTNTIYEENESQFVTSFNR